MKKMTKGLCIVCMMLLTSCATIISGTKQTVQINSTPPGAKILVDGIDRGTTPAAVRLKRKHDGQAITLKAEGFETRTFEPETSFNGIAVINLISWLGWGIDFISGAAWKYDPKFYQIELEPKKQ
jgi:hypothetical protein